MSCPPSRKREGAALASGAVDLPVRDYGVLRAPDHLQVASHFTGELAESETGIAICDGIGPCAKADLKLFAVDSTYDPYVLSVNGGAFDNSHDEVSFEMRKATPAIASAAVSCVTRRFAASSRSRIARRKCNRS